MADFLTHVFLPLTAAYVIWPEKFPTPTYLLLGGFGLLSDFDKFLGQPGLLHSLVTLVPLAVILVLVEWWTRGRPEWTLLVIALVFSHLVLDFLDGGPLPLLYPIVEIGVGLQYPARTVFGTGLFGVSIEGPLVLLRTATPRPGFNTYGFITGYGVTSLLLFLIVYASRQQRISDRSR